MLRANVTPAVVQSASNPLALATDSLAPLAHLALTVAETQAAPTPARAPQTDKLIAYALTTACNARATTLEQYALTAAIAKTAFYLVQNASVLVQEQ